MPANPVEAGKKGGKSKSAAKLAACKRNGFQRLYPVKPSESEIKQTPVLIYGSKYLLRSTDLRTLAGPLIVPSEDGE